MTTLVVGGFVSDWYERTYERPKINLELVHIIWYYTFRFEARKTGRTNA